MSNELPASATMGVPLWNQPAPPLSELRPTGPLAAITQALRDGATPDVLKQMMELQRDYERDEARKAFIAAFAAARAEIKPIRKTETASFDSRRTGEHTEYVFEDMAKIAEYVDPILARHGLSYSFEAKQADGMMLTITCVLEHVQGGSRRAAFTAGHDTSGSKNPVQALGSTATYLERYTLKAVLGLAAGKDDDAQGAGRAAPEPEPLIDAEQYRYLKDKIEEAGTTEAKLLYVVDAKDLESLTQAQFREAKAQLLRKIEKNKKGQDDAAAQ